MVLNQTGKHPHKSITKNLVKIIDELCGDKVFSLVHGRMHSHFSKHCVNVTKSVDGAKFQQWMSEHVHELMYD